MYRFPTVPIPLNVLKFMYCLGIIPAHVKACTHLTINKNVISHEIGNNYTSDLQYNDHHIYVNWPTISLIYSFDIHIPLSQHVHATLIEQYSADWIASDIAQRRQPHASTQLTDLEVSSSHK